MSCVAKPRIWRDKYVTEAGGKMKVLCLVTDGIAFARKQLAIHLAQLEQEKLSRPDLSIYPLSINEAIAKFLKSKQSNRPKRTCDYYTG